MRVQDELPRLVSIVGSTRSFHIEGSTTYQPFVFLGSTLQAFWSLFGSAARKPHAPVAGRQGGASGGALCAVAGPGPRECRSPPDILNVE